MSRKARGPGTISIDERAGVVVLRLPPDAARDLADVIQSGLPWTDAAYRDADDLRTLADRLDPPPETT